MGGKAGGSIGLGGDDFTTRYPNLAARRAEFRERLHAGPLGQILSRMDQSMAPPAAAAPAPTNPDTPATPAPSMSDSDAGAIDAADPAGPGLGEPSQITQDPGGASAPPAMPTGDMMAQTVMPAMWTDQMKRKAPDDGSLNVTGQV